MGGHHAIEDSTLRERMRAAIGDDRLRDSLVQATDQFEFRKAAAYEAFVDVEELRDFARAAKAQVLATLPDLLEQFADNVTAAGGVVHWADTAEDANRIIGDIVQGVGGRQVVKSKSMASEEVGLNDALESLGCQVTETDLGEWIIQLAGETPSHIIVPAIHKDRAQIAETLRQVSEGDLTDVPEELAAFARATLRQRFLEADVGISGVNFGVAETGTIHLVSNEGNGRLCTSVPRVHVALMGMERLVASWDQLDVMLALLPRAATGQAITTYNSFITGPRRPDESEGPEELHVVILDNGRSDILGSEFHEMLACVRCGACLNACPVYRQAGGHAYGWVYSGPMGAVLTPLLARAEAAGEVSQASSLCGACWDACPVKIPLQDLLLGLRRRAAEDAGRGERMAWRTWSAAWSRPQAYRRSLKLGSLAAAVDVNRLPGPSQRWTATRQAPRPPRRGFRDLWDEGIQ